MGVLICYSSLSSALIQVSASVQWIVSYSGHPVSVLWVVRSWSLKQCKPPKWRCYLVDESVLAGYHDVTKQHHTTHPHHREGGPGTSYLSHFSNSKHSI